MSDTDSYRDSKDELKKEEVMEDEKSRTPEPEAQLAEEKSSSEILDDAPKLKNVVFVPKSILIIRGSSGPIEKSSSDVTKAVRKVFRAKQFFIAYYKCNYLVLEQAEKVKGEKTDVVDETISEKSSSTIEVAKGEKELSKKDKKDAKKKLIKSVLLRVRGPTSRREPGVSFLEALHKKGVLEPSDDGQFKLTLTFNDVPHEMIVGLATTEEEHNYWLGYDANRKKIILEKDAGIAAGQPAKTSRTHYWPWKKDRKLKEKSGKPDDVVNGNSADELTKKLATELHVNDNDGDTSNVKNSSDDNDKKDIPK